jgi:hypothetical protein
MSEFYLVKIDDVFLTRDGTETGRACLLTVSGASDLLNIFSGNVTLAIDGTPIVQMFETGTKGKTLEIKVDVLLSDVWTSLVNLINTALSEGETLNIIGTGDITNFNVNAVPLLPKPFEANEFVNGRIKDAIFRFITT